MTRMVQCKKLSRELPGLTFIPFDDELGQRIYDQISAQAWQMWLEHSKMLINEYRLDLVTPEAFNLLHKRCEDFFFGEGSSLPPDYQPPSGHGHGHHH